MRAATAWGAGLLGVILSGAPAPGAETPADAAALLEPMRRRHELPGLAALALRGDQIIAQGVTGVRKAGATAPLTLADKFHLGSDTKAMTATLAGLLVDEGKLQWSATLRVLFRPIDDMPEEWRNVTLAQVLAHRAGLQANPGFFLRTRLQTGAEPLPEQRRRVMLAALAEAPLHEPGSKFAYSNTGYIIVGAALEKITGESWETLMRDRLFAPLGITSGGFGAPSATDANQPFGHHANGRIAAADADNPAFYGPAGTAHMSLPDWAKFIALHLRGDPANPARRATLLKPETFAKLHTPAPGESYAGGWGIATRPWAKGERTEDIGRVLTHAGSNTMWYCVAWLAPEIDFAVLVACNRGGDEAGKACDEAAGAMIRAFAKRNDAAAPR